MKKNLVPRLVGLLLIGVLCACTKKPSGDDTVDYSAAAAYETLSNDGYYIGSFQTTANGPFYGGVGGESDTDPSFLSSTSGISRGMVTDPIEPTATPDPQATATPDPQATATPEPGDPEVGPIAPPFPGLPAFWLPPPGGLPPIGPGAGAAAGPPPAGAVCKDGVTGIPNGAPGLNCGCSGQRCRSCTRITGQLGWVCVYPPGFSVGDGICGYCAPKISMPLPIGDPNYTALGQCGCKKNSVCRSCGIGMRCMAGDINGDGMPDINGGFCCVKGTPGCTTCFMQGLGHHCTLN